MQDSMIGVGSALRKARERRGITLDAASRDTKLHIDQLRALEAEDFEALMGDVYVRGSLRTYSQYLGLSPDKVIGAYDRHAETPPPPPPPAKLGRIERAMAASRIRDNQLLMILLAGTVLVVAVVFGLLSRGHSAPEPATLPTVAAEPDPLDQQIDAVVEAVGDVGVTVTADGVESTFAMQVGETRTFTAQTDLAPRGDRRWGHPAHGERQGLRHPRQTGPAVEPAVQFRPERRSDAVGVSVRAEIVGVGTELLLGQIANTNARWISERLATVGVDVLHHQAVGDNIPRIIQVLEVALGRADIVLVTGGLGPTEDDLTRDAIAELLGVPMVRHPEIEELLREKFAGYGRGDMPLSNLRQADVPEGMRTITPDRGTAPGSWPTSPRASGSTRCRACRSRWRR